MPRDLLQLVREHLSDRYQIEKEIGQGGAARVFRARNREGQLVALKILRPELIASITAQRFLREITVLQQLDHPLISKLLDFGEADWLIYYVMDYVEGPTLRAYLDRHGQAPLDATVRGSAEILDAVAHAHSRGIVHRDVKPENIVLSPQGACLVDFGIARAVAESAGKAGERLTRSGFTVGTSAYMSPEQAQGQPPDHRSDIYALGCVLFESLAGRPPYSHPMEIQVLRMHSAAPVPDICRFRPDVPKALSKVAQKALAKEPGERWQSAAEMREALLKAAQA